MPNRKKKDHKCSHHTSGGSHWQNFHFSGKLIVCSVIFGFMLILVGGIVYAIGTDHDDDTKSDDYEDLQKKPPMTIVGPVMMGIGGFIVFVGVGMCLVETNVCRRRNVENSPLIDGESGPKDSEASGIESESTAIPSSSHRHRNGNRKKSPSPRRAKLVLKKPHFTKDRNQESTSPMSPSSAPIDVGGNKTKNFFSASDKFLTPPSSFVRELHVNSRDAENQTSSSLMQSFISSGNSWTASTEFQTPNASSIENSICLESSKLNDGIQDQLDPNTSIINSHNYLTPKNSNAEMMIPVEMNDSEVSISNDPLKQNFSDKTVETQNMEAKQHLLSHSDALITESVKEIAVPEGENLESECNSTGSTLKELGPLLLEESKLNIESPIEVIQSSSINGDDASEKEIGTNHSDEIPFDSSLKRGTEQNTTNQEFLNEKLDQKCELTETDIQVVSEDNQGNNEVVLKALEESKTTSNEIVCTNNNQEEGDDSQMNDLKSKSLESVEKIEESESTNDISDSSRKSSLNNDET